MTHKPSVLPSTFYVRHMEDRRQSAIEGRKVLVPEEWIRIRLGADKVERPVTDEDREKLFPLEYEAWKRGQSMPGTPVQILAKECPEMFSEDSAVELQAAFGITTLEQLADYPDGKMTLGYGRAWQKKAREVLDRIEEEKAQAVIAQRDSEAESLKARVATLEAELARIRELTQAPQVQPAEEEVDHVRS